MDSIDATDFVITNGPSQVYHLRALNEVERQRWVTALELAKAKAIKNLESGVCVGGGGEGRVWEGEGEGEIEREEMMHNYSCKYSHIQQDMLYT